jgi:hypothetical protein
VLWWARATYTTSLAGRLACSALWDRRAPRGGRVHRGGGSSAPPSRRHHAPWSDAAWRAHSMHALLPVPGDVLDRGPTDPVALAWMAAHWGTTDLLRLVSDRPRAPALAFRPITAWPAMVSSPPARRRACRVLAGVAHRAAADTSRVRRHGIADRRHKAAQNQGHGAAEGHAVGGGQPAAVDCLEAVLLAAFNHKLS